MKLSEALKKSGVSAIIYGEAGSGKTYFAGTLPGKTLIIAVESNGIKTLKNSKNAENIEIEYLPEQDDTIEENSENLNNFFSDLMIKDLKFDNIVLDSATELSNRILIQRSDPNKNGGSPTMKTYAEVQFAMKRYMRILRDLAEIRGKNVIVTALEAELVLAQYNDTQTSKTHPALSGKKLAPEIEGLFDVVGHLEKLTDGRRFIRLEGTETFVAKDRFGRMGCFADGEIFLSGRTGKETNTNTNTNTNTKHKQ